MSNNKSKSYEFIKKLNIMLSAKMTTWVTTTEEDRFFRLFKRIAKVQKSNNEEFKVYSWSITEGLLDITKNMLADNNVYKKPIKILNPKKPNKNQESEFGGFNENNDNLIYNFLDLYDFIENNSDNNIFIIKDIHNLLEKNKLDYPHMVRKLRDLVSHVKLNDVDIIFVAPITKIPADLETDIQVLDMPRPDEYDIEELLEKSLSDMHWSEPSLNFDIDFVNDEGILIKSKHPDAVRLKEKIIMNLRGLTESEISQIIKFICVKNLGIDEKAINEIKDTKRQIIEKNGVLSFVAVPQEIQVGGHEEFKKYIDSRSSYLDKKKKEKFNLSAPKGVLLVGLSGCGKSILAKYVGNKWNIPLIRLNIDVIFGKFLGESENNLRTALSIAEANAPCILFIDEIDKSLGGITSSGDSGTGMRILGKILTWMQEREEMIFLFATANNVSHLPKELLRAGRFDCKFWADLPSLQECKDIFKIKSFEKGFQLKDAEYNKLAKITFGKSMTGAEIEHTVSEGSFIAAEENLGGGIEIKHIEKAISMINPHAITNKTKLDEERKIALENYIFTSDETKKVIKSQINS